MKWMDAIRRALGLDTYRRPAFVEGRSTFRMRCTLPVVVSVRSAKNARTVTGQVINVSTRGVKIETGGLLRRGEQADLVIRSSRPPKSLRSIPELKLLARVIWCKKRGS
ncbi:MAG: PilZ domain-containing protein [Candidatus Xenobia bacterium]